MKCPRCGFVSFEYLDECRKCHTEMLSHKESYDIEMERAEMLPILAYYNRQQEKKRDELQELAESSVVEDEGFVVDEGDHTAVQTESYEEEVVSLESLTGDDEEAVTQPDVEATMPPVATPEEQSKENEEPVALDVVPEDISLDLSDIVDEEPLQVDLSLVEKEAEPETETGEQDAEEEVSLEVSEEPEVTEEPATEELSLEELQLKEEPLNQEVPQTAYDESDVEEVTLEDLSIDITGDLEELEVVTDEDDHQVASGRSVPEEAPVDIPDLNLSLESDKDAGERIKETLNKKEEVKLDTSIGKLEIEQD